MQKHVAEYHSKERTMKIQCTYERLMCISESIHDNPIHTLVKWVITVYRVTILVVQQQLVKIWKEMHLINKGKRQSTYILNLFLNLQIWRDNFKIHWNLAPKTGEKDEWWLYEVKSSQQSIIWPIISSIKDQRLIAIELGQTRCQRLSNQVFKHQINQILERSEILSHLVNESGSFVK